MTFPAAPLEVPDLSAELRALLAQIPAGCVTTYGDLAEALGDAAAARWVSEYLRDHPHDEACPCHRVVRRTGEVGLYVSGDPAEKRSRLQAESVPLSGGEVLLAACRFTQFRARRPLQRLSQFQAELPERVRLTPFSGCPKSAAGVDVSYLSPQQALGAYVVVDVATGMVAWSALRQREVHFPYIPGYLAFREVPLMWELHQLALESRQAADVVFVDGNGRLHHRRAGVATHFGVLADVPTVGVGKRLLCGTVDLQGMHAAEARPVSHAGEVVGMAVKSGPSSRPIYVSPGQHMDVASCVRLARLVFRGHRVPEPIYLADQLSRRAAMSADGDKPGE